VQTCMCVRVQLHGARPKTSRMVLQHIGGEFTSICFLFAAAASFTFCSVNVFCCSCLLRLFLCSQCHILFLSFDRRRFLRAFIVYIHVYTRTYSDGQTKCRYNVLLLLFGLLFGFLCACIHHKFAVYDYTYMHSYTGTYIHTYMHACMRVCIQAFIYTNIQTEIHPYMHTYTHTYKQTNIRENVNLPLPY